MSLRSAALAALLLPSLARAEAVLHVYGPGGPLGPVRACADRFARARGIAVRVDGGPEEAWVAQAEKDGDVVFAVAEYALSDLARRRPDLVDPSTRESLYDRAAAILVRKGNPKHIRSLADLARPGVRILDVNGAGQIGLWEDLAGRHGLIGALQRNIAATTSNTGDAIARWRSTPELDAWITFATWHDRLRDVSDLVELPKADRLYRGTPVAVTRRSERRTEALAFVAFLKSEECHALFRAAGWR